jgi:hypothetical protein
VNKYLRAAAGQDALLHALATRLAAEQRLAGRGLVANSNQMAALPNQLAEFSRRAVVKFKTLRQLLQRRQAEAGAACHRPILTPFDKFYGRSTKKALK